MTDKLEILSEKIIPNSEKVELEISTIIKKLTKLKEDGVDSYKKKKIEEALKIFLKGYILFHEVSKKFSNEYFISKSFDELLILFKTILPNLALCYYKLGSYKEAIIYDLEMIALEPKYGRSIVRLFKSYSKINKVQQAVFYGNVFLDLDIDTRKKFKGINEIIEEEKIKLKNIQKQEKNKANKDLIIIFGSFLILFIALIFYLLKKR